MNNQNSIFSAVASGLKSVWRFYIDGFRSMTIGRSLWLLIIIKVIVLFAVFKLWFFPNVLERDYPDDRARAAAVRGALTDSTDNNHNLNTLNLYGRSD